MYFQWINNKLGNDDKLLDFLLNTAAFFGRSTVVYDD